MKNLLGLVVLFATTYLFGQVQVTPDATGNLQLSHIIWMLQENQTFDEYFGHLNAYRTAHGEPASVDGTPVGASNPAYSGGGTVNAYHFTTVCFEDLTPSWNESRRDVNRSNPLSKTSFPMNGFVYSAANYAINEDKKHPGSYADTKGIRSMGYYTERELPYYYFMATQFATSDRFFSPILSRTNPNRLANFAASALGVVNNIPSGSSFKQKTIFTLLQNAGISWKIYELNGNTFLGYFSSYGAYKAAHVFPISQYFTDLKNGTLPAVAFIETTGPQDEHPGENVQKGSAEAAIIINALRNSSSWASSAFIEAFDEGGGMYDHVPPQSAVIPDSIPPNLSATDDKDTYSRTGFRIPLLVISPFAKVGYVSHTVMDTTAVMKFIEIRFGLPSLTARDAAQPSMDEFFDWVNKPNLNAPAPPVQPTNAPCYYNKLP
jgi:phospholipase C